MMKAAHTYTGTASLTARIQSIIHVQQNDADTKNESGLLALQAIISNKKCLNPGFFFFKEFEMQQINRSSFIFYVKETFYL